MMQRSGGAALILLWVQVAAAQMAPLHVLASNGVKAGIEALKPACESALGRTLTVNYDSSAGLKRKIEGGEAFDLAIVTPETTADLVKSGKLADGTATDLARTGIGFGIRAGAPKPDIATAEAVKQTLLKAKSIALVREGASRATIEKIFERLGIAQAMASKVKLESGTEKAGEGVAKGETELEMVPISEISLVPGVQILGPLPDELQSYVRFQISLSANTHEGTTAKKTIACLTSPVGLSVFKAYAKDPQ